MASKDPVESAGTDRTYDQLHTPLNAPKAAKDPQAALDNPVIPMSTGKDDRDPMGYLPK